MIKKVSQLYKYSLISDSRLAPLTYRRVAIDHAVLIKPLGVVFNRIPKAGSTSTTNYLSEIFDGSGNSRNVVGVTQATANEVRASRKFERMLISRNPYTRTLSAFLDCSRRPHYSGVPGFQERNPEGFLRFLKYLDDGGLNRNPHWAPQFQHLLWPLGTFQHHFKLETLAGDIQELFRSKGIENPSSGLFGSPHPREVETGKATGARDQVGTFYGMEAIRLLRRLFLSDFEEFGYDTRPQNT